MRISKLVAACNQIQESIYWLVFPAEKGVDCFTIQQPNELIERIQSLADEVDAICARASASPLDLTERSRHAYLWLKFLTDPAHLQMHLAALQTAHAASDRLSCRRRGPPALKRAPVRVQFYLLKSLYRVNFRREVTLIQANEGFVTAPPQLIEALIEAALCTHGRRALALVRQYADSAGYSQALKALSNGNLARPEEVKGKFYDLEASFSRVNQTYFDGTVERPHLTWNRTLTYRKLGHYQPNTDTVQVSLTLDNAAVPEFVLDYVMYHELLHKCLGIHYKNGRRVAHTSRFRTEEKKFQRYTEAVEFINQIGQQIPARKRLSRPTGRRTKK